MGAIGPPAEEGIYHWENEEDVPEDVLKYWQQRYDIFPSYDEGIWMTEDAWFGVTPHPIAEMIATHVREGAPKSKTVLIDCFAGAGGNVIAFAKSGKWDQIFAIEKDPRVLKCAKHNAEVQGVSKKIFWSQGDSLTLVPQRFRHLKDKAVIFASPPWGGPGYRTDEVFNLSTMQPYNMDTLYNAFSKVTKDMVLYLPRTSDLNQLVKYAPEDRKLEVAHYAMKGASKALCVYLGDFMFEEEE